MRKSVTYRPGRLDANSCHLVIWVDTEPVPRREQPAALAVRATARRAWVVGVIDSKVHMARAPVDGGPDGLYNVLHGGRTSRTPLTVWLARGWESLCLSGLAELIERGDISYSRLTLDGERVVLRGKVGQKPLSITSLTAWTGGAWDGWAPACLTALNDFVGADSSGPAAQALLSAPRGERVLLGSVVSILRTCVALSIGRPTLAMGGMARRWWAAWGGRTLRDSGARPEYEMPDERRRVRRIVIPLPRRPRHAALAEPHAAHGLVREQYYRGHVGGRVHVLDLGQAYLIALAVAKIPATYERTAHGIDVGELRRWCGRGEALALCRLSGVTSPVTRWRDRRPARLVGDCWAWLCGDDLEQQLDEGRVCEVERAHLWRALAHTPRCRDYLLSVREALRAECGEWALPVWRGLYSALPGSWAQSVYHWQDSKTEFRSAKWATFLYPGPKPGDVEHYRVIGGRVQKRIHAGEAPHALPLAYACVTACVRTQVDYLREHLPAGGVLATACDALWITDACLRDLRAGTDPVAEREGRWGVKETFDDAWMDGRGRAVVLRGNTLYPMSAGVPGGAPLGADGRARWERAEPWAAADSADPTRPQRKLRSAWDGGRLVRENDRPLSPISPWLNLHEEALPEDLLLPFDPRTTGRTDDEHAEV